MRAKSPVGLGQAVPAQRRIGGLDDALVPIGLNLGGRVPTELVGRLLGSDGPAGYPGQQRRPPGPGPAFEGTNDIWDSEGNYGGCGRTSRVTAGQLIAGYQTLIRAAHARDVRIIGATIIPFKAPYMSPADFLRAEAVRDQVNHWIRTSGEFDAVVDFAKAVADPADPEELNPAYNSGDFLHPNDAGYRAIAAAIKLNEL